MNSTKVHFVTLLMLTLSLQMSAQPGAKGFVFKEIPEKKQLDVTYNGRLLTSYCYYDSVMKPVLFPLNTVSGITVTRGYPLTPREGERVDHPHHIGLWLNYEHVNGLDFWNHSTAIPYERRSKYGTIRHDRITGTKAGRDEAILDVSAQWQRPDKATLLHETTRYIFNISGNDFIIDRTTTLQAVTEDVSFKDVKDGFLGMRVARELELPSDDKVKLVTADGTVSSDPVAGSENVTGMYLSSVGLKGDDVWGTRAKWVTLSGVIRGKQVSATIIDHPDNIGYPSYWHARGYGLFAVNPFGQEVFSQGKEALNFVLRKSNTVTFKYRVIIHEGKNFTPEEINKLLDDFSRKN